MQETIYALQLKEEDFTFTIYTCTLHKYNADKSTYIASINGIEEAFTLYNHSVQELHLAHTDREKEHIKELRKEGKDTASCFFYTYLLCTSLQEGMQYLLEQEEEDVRNENIFKEKRIQKTMSKIKGE